MGKEKRREISIVTVFNGKKDSRQAFIELIIHRHKSDSMQLSVDSVPSEKYNQDKVFSDVRVDREEQIA